MKITFTGDIMIEPPVLKAAKQKDGSYDFYPVFAKAQKLLSEADLLIGNMETPIAGAAVGYTDDYYAFNAPDTYADAIKKAGFHMVSTANNHVFDRGFAGAERTLEMLDQRGIGHHGSFHHGGEHPEAWYSKLGDTTLAVVAYTYGTNYGESGKDFLAEGEMADTLNLLRPQEASSYQPGVLRGKDWVDKLFKHVSDEGRGRIKRFLGMEPNYPRADDRLDRKAFAPYLARFQADIRKARERADIVIAYPHVGGQFNPRPGAISEDVMDKAIEAGVDAVIASHAHMVQKAVLRDGIPCAYSLGNFNMDPTSSLMLPELLPHYGLLMHLYIEGGKIQRTTFSVIKAVRDGSKQICAWPVDELYETLNDREKTQLRADVKQIYRVVNECDPEDDTVRREYPLINQY